VLLAVPKGKEKGEFGRGIDMPRRVGAKERVEVLLTKGLGNLVLHTTNQLPFMFFVSSSAVCSTSPNSSERRVVSR